MNSILAVLFLAFTCVFAVQVTVEVQMTNLAPINGASLTPLWVGFHDGSYDTFSSGSSASAALESIAEDGASDSISANFLAADSSFVDGTIVADNSEIPVVQFGQTATQTFVIDSDDHQYVSLLSMVVPSNDAFVGNGNPMAYRIFDDDEFVPLTVTWEGNEVWDAGTEVNDEIPANTAFFGQAAPNTGTDENGVVELHEGLNAPGSGGIVDSPEFVNADFSATGYVVGSVTIRQITSDDDDDVVANDDDDDDNDDDNADDDDDNVADDDDDNVADDDDNVADDDDDNVNNDDDDNDDDNADDDDNNDDDDNDDDNNDDDDLFDDDGSSSSSAAQITVGLFGLLAATLI